MVDRSPWNKNPENPDAVSVEKIVLGEEPELTPERGGGGIHFNDARLCFQSWLSCATCHPAPLFTDLKMYDVGTTKGQDAGKPVDTPTLIECWRTAPYLHDGRASTLREVITIHNPANTRGQTTRLADQQIDDLVEYIRSL